MSKTDELTRVEAGGRVALGPVVRDGRGAPSTARSGELLPRPRLGSAGNHLLIAGGDNYLHSIPMPARFWQNDPSDEVARVRRSMAIELSQGAPVFRVPVPERP